MIHRRVFRELALVLAVLSGVAWAVPAAAAEPAETCPATINRLKAAYLEDPRPAYLLDIGHCYRTLGQGTEAIRLYRSYLERQPDAPDRAAVEAAITALEHPTAPLPVPRPKPPASVAPVALAQVVAAPAPPATTSRRTWLFALGAVVLVGATAGILIARRDPPCPMEFPCR